MAQHYFPFFQLITEDISAIYLLYIVCKKNKCNVIFKGGGIVGRVEDNPSNAVIMFIWVSNTYVVFPSIYSPMTEAKVE